MKQLAKTLSLLCLLALPALTQEFRSTISGHVTDASGAAVPGAKVTAQNIANNESTSATTDGSGAYAIPFLRPGDYKVTATASGFKLYTQAGLTLEAAKVTGVDIHLEVGAVTESVEVTAEAVALDTQISHPLRRRHLAAGGGDAAECAQSVHAGRDDGRRDVQRRGHLAASLR